MIPDGTLYGNPELGAGEVATIEDVTLTTEQAGADIGYGQGVQIKDGLLVPATSGNIYGIALRRTHVNADHLYPEDMAKEHWSAGEWFGCVREGTVAVPISEDVNSRENAAVDANGNFKPAGASDTVVGVFLSSGNKGGTARLQTRIQLSNTSVTGEGRKNDVPTTPAVNAGPADTPSTQPETKPADNKSQGGK
ncbi:structural cement protein Gp24 [Lactobacillus intestinalis]|uniref:structural cement protein Gp24 n=1 Tax=Lactobacillus intestinalis TaxID=151781 RepID=UPI0002C945F2|nr:hypothetical protein [Lactobacillus intestinalis]KAI4308851.1 hypothetical protein C821_000519 [Lactobacillus intestinalis]